MTLDATGQFVCAFTIDNDLKGNHDGAVLDMSGGLTVHWQPGGDLSCPSTAGGFTASAGGPDTSHLSEK